MNVGILIESRSKSTRLPGKCFKEIRPGTPLVEMVYDRCMLARGVDVVKVICPPFDELSDFCDGKGIRCQEAPPGTRTGSVLEELYTAAVGFDMCVEITGDCPCIDPAIITWAVDFFKANQPLDFCGWVHQKGAEVRVFTRHAIDRAIDAIEYFERNGTTIFYNQPVWKKEMMWRVFHPYQGMYDLSVDTEAGLEFIREIYRRVAWDASLSEILDAASEITPPRPGERASPDATTSTS